MSAQIINRYFLQVAIVGRNLLNCVYYCGVPISGMSKRWNYTTEFALSTTRWFVVIQKAAFSVLHALVKFAVSPQNNI